jgi:uncharacterized membrane protein YciS (DUF1049 family)
VGDRDAERVTYVYPPVSRPLRQGPGAFAWISLGLFVLATAALVYAFIVGAYGSALVSMLAVAALSLPTLILMSVWIEVRIDNRRVTRRREADFSGDASLH